ncbi:MAG TPA: hypothetical protein VD973_09445 [Symbiobacteriaceae bacterium]|nr:hypothetical protein [Symbiobacteriaceae bacterium]
MQISINRLKEKLRLRLLDKLAYGTGKLTLAMVTSKALQIALQVVDEVAEQTEVPKPKPEPSFRKIKAAEKWQRVLKVMQEAGKPLRVSEIMRKAHLTTGEASWLVKSTPGIVQVAKGTFELRGNT